MQGQFFLPSTFFKCWLKPQFLVFKVKFKQSLKTPRSTSKKPTQKVISKFNDENDSQVYRLCDHGGSRGLKFTEIITDDYRRLPYEVVKKNKNLLFVYRSKLVFVIFNLLNSLINTSSHVYGNTSNSHAYSILRLRCLSF